MNVQNFLRSRGFSNIVSQIDHTSHDNTSQATNAYLERQDFRTE